MLCIPDTADMPVQIFSRLWRVTEVFSWTKLVLGYLCNKMPLSDCLDFWGISEGENGTALSHQVYTLQAIYKSFSTSFKNSICSSLIAGITIGHKTYRQELPCIRSNQYEYTEKILSKLHLGTCSDLLIPDTGYPMSLLKCLASSWQTRYSWYYFIEV